jgi:hypothetical protein
MTDLAKEPIEKLNQFVCLLMPNTPMHTALIQEIERRKRHRDRVTKIINGVALILSTIAFIITWLTVLES